MHIVFGHFCLLSYIHKGILGTIWEPFQWCRWRWRSQLMMMMQWFIFIGSHSHSHFQSHWSLITINSQYKTKSLNKNKNNNNNNNNNNNKEKTKKNYKSIIMITWYMDWRLFEIWDSGFFCWLSSSLIWLCVVQI